MGYELKELAVLGCLFFAKISDLKQCIFNVHNSDYIYTFAYMDAHSEDAITVRLMYI